MKKILVSVLILAGLVMTGCENFLAETDFKEKLNDTITIAKSQDVKLKIASDRDYYGIFLDNMEGDFTFKMKQTVTVRFQLDPACSFKRWMIADSVTGKEIEDAVKVIEEITETENVSEVHTIKFTFLKAMPNLQLKPVCYLKNDTTAPEFTAFEVYNLGTYDEENEENNVLVTDKVFEEWTEDEDFENHHVNGLKLKFTVREDDSDFRNGKISVVEKLIKNADGTENKKIKQYQIDNCNELSDILKIEEKNGFYYCILDYNFVLPEDGVVCLYFSLIDAAGNENLDFAKKIFVIKDTQLNLYYRNSSGQLVKIIDYDSLFYYLPAKLASDGIIYDSWMNSFSTKNQIKNFEKDTGEGGYANPEVFESLMDKLIFSGNVNLLDLWYENDNTKFTTDFMPKICFSQNDEDYNQIELKCEKMKEFSDSTSFDGNSEYELFDAYYLDTSSFSKTEPMYFDIYLEDTIGNYQLKKWNNLSSMPSISVENVKKLSSRATMPANPEDYGYGNAYPVYEWNVKVVPDCKPTGYGYSTLDSAGFFYYTEEDGVKSSVKYSGYIGYSYYGSESGSYMSSQYQRSHGINDPLESEDPSQYSNLSYHAWNVPAVLTISYNFEGEEQTELSIKCLTQPISFSFDNLTNYSGFNGGMLRCLCENITDNLGNRTDEYQLVINTEYGKEYDKIVVNYKGKTFTKYNSSYVTVTGLSADEIINGLTFDAYALLNSNKYYFDGTYFIDSDLLSRFYPKELAEFDFLLIGSVNFDECFPELAESENQKYYMANRRKLLFCDDKFIEEQTGTKKFKVYYTDKIMSDSGITGLPFFEVTAQIMTYERERISFQVAGFVLDYSIFSKGRSYVYIELSDGDDNIVYEYYDFDNTLLGEELTLENTKTTYVSEGLVGTLVNKELNNSDFNLCYYYEDNSQYQYLNRSTNTLYYIPGVVCNTKNVIKNEDGTAYLIYSDQSVLVEYIMSDKYFSSDLPYYWEHLNSDGNKTFTQLTVANPGQATVKGYKIPKVPAGKYGFIIFHFADGTSMNSGVIEG